MSAHAFMEFCPVDAHISLSPKGLEAGQKADRRSACASILGTPEGFQHGHPSWPFCPESFQPLFVALDLGLLMDN
jgi:hypothetical protein